MSISCKHGVVAGSLTRRWCQCTALARISGLPVADFASVSSQTCHLDLARSPLHDSFYISLFRNGAGDDWAWMDGSEVDFSAWGGGEPNNQFGSENCAVVVTRCAENRPISDWNDIPCVDVRDAVCEKIRF